MDVKKELYYLSENLATERVAACYAIYFSRNGDEESKLIPTVTCIGPELLRDEISRRLWEIKRYVTLGVTPDDALREELAMLQAENHRLLNEVNELRKQPTIPETVIKSVWCDGVTQPRFAECFAPTEYELQRERIAEMVAEALRRG